ncbi:MAG: hypothetical protein P8Y96_02645 [Desulfuromonadales bacterium]|jgi:hypothetical protein
MFPEFSHGDVSRTSEARSSDVCGPLVRSKAHEKIDQALTDAVCHNKPDLSFLLFLRFDLFRLASMRFLVGLGPAFLADEFGVLFLDFGLPFQTLAHLSTSSTVLVFPVFRIQYI